MKKISKKAIIISAVTFVLICSTVIASAFTPVSNLVQSILGGHKSKFYTLDTSEIVYKEGMKREDFSNSFEYLMARDGFIYGCDYDWTSDNEYSNHSLGTNHINLDGNQAATYNHYQIYIDLYNIKAIGFNATNYWLLSSLQGITFDEDGYVVKVDDEFLTNLRDLLQTCRDVGLMIVPSLQPHGGANSWGGYNTKGEGPAEVWNKYFKFLWQDEAQQKYLDNVIDPICEIFAEYQDIILFVGLTIENASGWVSDMDYGYVQGDIGTTWENWAKFSNALNDRVKAKAPDLLTSCEEMGGDEKLYRYNDLKADILGANYYHSGGWVPPREQYFTERVGYVGEMNTHESGDYNNEFWGQKRQQMMLKAKENGWIGAFYFRYTSDSNPCNTFDPSSNTFAYESMYSWTWGFRNIINDGIAEHRGFKPEVETASLLANKGGKDVYWVPSRSTTMYKLERSDDNGKTWKLLDDAIDADTASCANGLIKYTDNEVHEGMSYCYRVTAYTEDGKYAVSVPNNIEDFFVAENIITNGSFEDGYNSWNVGNKRGEIVTEEKFDGDHCFKFDFNDSTKVEYYGGLNQIVPVKQNTTYTCTFQVKTVEAGKWGEPAYIEVKSETNKKSMVKNWIASLTDPNKDDGWDTRTITFVTTNDTEIRLNVSCGDNKDGHGIIYVDNIVVKEMR